MRIENSPEYEAEMDRRLKAMAREDAANKAAMATAKERWRKAGRKWLPMAECPFRALDAHYGLEGSILVSDGEVVALATVTARFGTPLVWTGKEPPETVYRDGGFAIVGDGKYEKPKAPAWWFKWELTDVFGRENYAGGEPVGKDGVSFMPTKWTFLPEPTP